MSIVPKESPLLCLLLYPALILFAVSTTMSATITIIVTSAETVHTVIVAMAVTTTVTLWLWATTTVNGDDITKAIAM